MQLAAQRFDGKTSAAEAVQVELLDSGVLLIHSRAGTQRHLLSAVSFSERIGNTPRRLQLPTGESCLLTDNDSIDRWLKSCGESGTEQAVFHLERRWSLALLALLVLIGVSWGFIRYGLPVLAEHIAEQLPTSVDDQLGAGALATLDKQFLSPSTLPTDQQQALHDAFERVIARLPDRQRYRLELRNGGKLIGANAFALPSGTVVMTDELVALSKDPNELLAVLAHEVGHVEHRHSLRMVLQSSGSALLMFALIGDVSGISSLAASIPGLLTQAKYSRSHEIEADDYAVQWLTSQGIATHYFGDLLTRLEQQHDERRGKDGKDATSVLGYFASHPRAAERVQRAQQSATSSSQ